MGRTRNFATVVYPESAPADWVSILGEHCIPAFISPLHDKDINPGGESKKEHHHVILMFDSVKTKEQAEAVFATIGGVGCEIVQSIRGYARYLCHLDNPEKAQYNTEEVRCYGGADYISTIGLAIDKYKAISEMEDFCEKYNIVSYYHLNKYARVHRPDWHRVLCESATLHMREFIKSMKWTRDVGYFEVLDPDTGELILQDEYQKYVKEGEC